MARRAEAAASAAAADASAAAARPERESGAGGGGGAGAQAGADAGGRAQTQGGAPAAAEPAAASAAAEAAAAAAARGSSEEAEAQALEEHRVPQIVRPQQDAAAIGRHARGSAGEDAPRGRGGSHGNGKEGFLGANPAALARAAACERDARRPRAASGGDGESARDADVARAVAHVAAALGDRGAGGGGSGSLTGKGRPGMPRVVPWSFRSSWAERTMPPPSRLTLVSHRAAAAGGRGGKGGKERVEEIAWHPSGRYFAVAGASGKVSVFTLADALAANGGGGTGAGPALGMRPVCGSSNDLVGVGTSGSSTPAGDAVAAAASSFSATAHWVRPDGHPGGICWVPGSDSMLAAGGAGGNLMVFDFSTGSMVMETVVEGGDITCIAAPCPREDADGRSVDGADTTGSEVEGHAILRAGNGACAEGLAGADADSCGSMIAVGTDGGIVSLVTVRATAQTLRRVPDRSDVREIAVGCRSAVRSIGFSSASDNRLAVGTAAGLVHIYDVSHAREAGSPATRKRTSARLRARAAGDDANAGLCHIQSIEVEGVLESVCYGRPDRVGMLTAGAGARLCNVQSESDDGSEDGSVAPPGAQPHDWNDAHVRSWYAHQNVGACGPLGFSISDADLEHGGVMAACGSEDGHVYVYNEHWRDAVARNSLGVRERGAEGGSGGGEREQSAADPTAPAAGTPPSDSTAACACEVVSALAWQPRGVSLGSPLLLSGGSAGTLALYELQDMSNVAAYFSGVKVRRRA